MRVKRNNAQRATTATPRNSAMLYNSKWARTPVNKTPTDNKGKTFIVSNNNNNNYFSKSNNSNNNNKYKLRNEQELKVVRWKKLR